MKRVEAFIEIAPDGFGVYTNHEFEHFGVTGYGKSADEAVQDFLTVFSELKQLEAEAGRTVEDIEWVFKYDTASMLNYLNGTLTKSAIARVTGLNRQQLTHYASGLKKPRPETVAKIQNGLNHFIDTIKQVQLV